MEKVLDRTDEATAEEPAKQWRNRYFDPNGLPPSILYQIVPNIFSMGGDGSFMGLVWPTKDICETMSDHFLGWTTEVLNIYGFDPFVWDAAYEVNE